MAGIFSGLEKLGLGNIDGGNLFEDPNKKEAAVKKAEPQKKLRLSMKKIIYLTRSINVQSAIQTLSQRQSARVR